MRAHRQSFAPACVPVFEGRRGNPVLFDKALFRELTELRGDTGGRELLEKYASAVVMVPADPAVLLDIDTPEDYERLCAGIGLRFGVANAHRTRFRLRSEIRPFDPTPDTNDSEFLLHGE